MQIKVYQFQLKRIKANKAYTVRQERDSHHKFDFTEKFHHQRRKIAKKNRINHIKKPSDPNSGVFADLDLEEIEEYALGRKLLDTISLQMKNLAPLANIARMLQELRENQLIRIDESKTEITALSAQVQQLESKIENIQLQLGILNDQEETLRTQRAKDAEEFAQRIKSTADVVEALNVVAAKLSAFNQNKTQSLFSQNYTIWVRLTLLLLWFPSPQLSQRKDQNNLQKKIIKNKKDC
ncbi:unnamed protein product [Paramecium octaurelia]|uniref:Uncharacterized protein n=1 Tax=Paramecium octaurelia TaxID=43137 RepID=A0A8S1SM28_PAROT|nr:unnamed protein product [Paramecium octaurelia]